MCIYCDCLPGLSYVPVAIVLWYSATFFITLGLAIAEGHVYPYFTYISDIAVNAPESCVFTQTLNVAAFFGLMFFYVRHRHVREVCERHDLGKHLKILSRLCWYLGICMSISSTILANFPKNEMLIMHTIGAVSSFLSMSSWILLQTYISFKLYPMIGHFCINYIRVILFIVCVVTFLICLISAFLAFKEYRGQSVLKWDPEDGGYEWHAVSVIMQWTFVYSTLACFLTFFYELKNVSMKEPVLKINSPGNST